MKKALRRLFYPLRAVFTWLLVLVVLFEEWGWEPLQEGLRKLGAWLGLARLGVWLQKLPPYAALMSLLSVSLVLLPFKLAAFALIARGHAVLGAVVFVCAKLIGTALFARLFGLVQPQLMQLPWFARYYGAWKRWKDALMARVRTSWAWRQGRALREKIRQWLRS